MLLACKIRAIVRELAKVTSSGAQSGGQVAYHARLGLKHLGTLPRSLTTPMAP
jgi:hypothetical protein